ncbi:MAG: hypothetical protein JW981_02130 [Anaerolineae bacterium]|nr:hypothetical protein [Anaerolineae bacterium]
MRTFYGVMRYEYRMSVRRWGFWLACVFSLALGADSMAPYDLSDIEILQYAGMMAFSLNMLLPVVGGIAMADRLVRDEHLGVEELLHSTLLSRRVYILGKYFGVLFSVLTPVFMCTVLLCALSLVQGMPVSLVPNVLLAFVAIIVPAYAFIAAFSLACPLVMPVRVYQILFTGYWFWGNFLNPERFPTLNGTLLTPVGVFALEGWFETPFGKGDVLHTATDAALNIAVLLGCVVIVLVALERFLAWRERSVER